MSFSIPVKQIPNASSEQPFAFFEYLLLGRGIGEMHNEFKALAKEKGGYFMPQHPHYELEDVFVYYIDVEKYGELHMVGYSYTTFLKDRITHEYGQAINAWSRGLDALNNENERSTYQTQYTSILNSYLEIANKHGNPYLKLIIEPLNNLQSYTQSRHASDNEKANSSFANDDNLVQSYFGFKKGIASISKLYKGLKEVGFFDEDDDQQHQFYKALTSYDKGDNIKLKVSCSVQETAFICRQLEPLFHNLSFTAIEQSELFINRHGKTITATDLSKALNSFNRKLDLEPDIVDKIQTLVHSFK